MTFSCLMIACCVWCASLGGHWVGSRLLQHPGPLSELRSELTRALFFGVGLQSSPNSCPQPEWFNTQDFAGEEHKNGGLHEHGLVR